MKTKELTRDELLATAERVYDAMEARCGCGYTGSWEHAVHGTAEDQPAIWAGCPNCTGSAVGRPLRPGAHRAFFRLPVSEQRRLVAQAVAARRLGLPVEEIVPDVRRRRIAEDTPEECVYPFRRIDRQRSDGSWEPERYIEIVFSAIDSIDVEPSRD